MNNPAISVVMSVYNGEKYLREAIESILNQTFNNFEFIIVNDGSEDGSLDIIKSYNDSRIVVVDQENTGLAIALNNGIQIAKGKYIARMDADDISLPNRLEKQFKFLENNPDCVAVGSNAIFITKEGEHLFVSNYPLEWADIRKNLPFPPILIHPSAMFRTDDFLKCDGYNKKIKCHIEDILLWNQLSKYGELANIKDPLIKYRLTPDSISNRPKRAGKLLNKVINNFVSNNLKDKEIKKLNKLDSTISKRSKLSCYHERIGIAFYVHKKNKKRSQKELFKALRYKFSVRSLYYLCRTFLSK